MNIRSLAALAAPLAMAAAVQTQAQSDSGDLTRGAYLARIMTCADCHAPRDATGAPDPSRGLVGGNVGFRVPGLAIVWGPNLTPDETGIAGWTVEDVVRALRTGETPEGRGLIPVMPWPAYAVLSDEDATSLAAYLLAQPAVSNRVPELQGPDDPAPTPYFDLVLPQ